LAESIPRAIKAVLFEASSGRRRQALDLEPLAASTFPPASVLRRFVASLLTGARVRYSDHAYGRGLAGRSSQP